MSNYEASRLANFGRDAAKSYIAFAKTEDRLVEEINKAVDNGIAPLKIAHDVMGRCLRQEARHNLLSILLVLAENDKIPKSVVEPFEAGIRTRRV